MADRIALNYQEEDEQGRLVGAKVLPFHLGIVGMFSGDDEMETHDKSFRLTRGNFSVFFERKKVKAKGYAANQLFPNQGDDYLHFEIPFQKFSDFHPGHIISHLGFVSEYTAFLSRFEKCVGRASTPFSEVFVEEDWKYLLSLSIPKEDNIKAIDVVHGLAEAYRRLNKQINEIIYHPTYQEVEFNWRSLWMLLQQNLASNIEISVIDSHRKVLESDLGSGLDITETDIFQRIYIDEVDQYGGTPYSMLLLAHQLSFEDLDIVQTLGELGRVSGCPVVMQMGADIFDIPSLDYIANNFSYDDLRLSEHFSKWAEFSNTTQARFCTFLLQNICARDSFRKTAVGQKGIMFDDLPPHASTNLGLYGSSVYAFSLPFMKTYAQFQSCVAVDEPPNFLVQAKLYEASFRMPTFSYAPTERVHEELSHFGFSVLIPEGRDGAFRLGTLNQFNANTSLERGSMVSIDLRMNVRLPQLLFSSQLTHYLRMIQRQSVAKHKPQQLKSELTSWLRRFISDGSSESAMIRAQRPLKRAEVDLVEVEHKTGKMLEFRLKVEPHAKYNGLNYELNI